MCRLSASLRFILFLLFLISLTRALRSGSSNKDDQVSYGVDVSFPIHNEEVTKNYPFLRWNRNASVIAPGKYKDMPLQPLGNKQMFYEDFMEGCYVYYREKGAKCRLSEAERLYRNLEVPPDLYNYTKIGYKKLRAPPELFRPIKEFWDANRGKEKKETWKAGDTHTNHWDSPSFKLNIENSDGSLIGGGKDVKKIIWNSAYKIISEWTGQHLAESSLYGIRVYKAGAILAPHVDRLPLVSSCIINVDADVDEPWPLEVIGHDGVAVNVTMEPGDMVLYESHTVIHGRQFPLKGRFMANIFVHFEPLGPLNEEIHVDPFLPRYIVPGSGQDVEFRSENPEGYRPKGYEKNNGIAAREEDEEEL